MKKFSKLFFLTFFAYTSSIYSQIIINKDLKISTAIELNSTFLGSTTIKEVNANIFKNQNFNTFYLIKEIPSTATKTFYSLDLLETKNGNYIIKTIYDSEKSIVSIHISSYDSVYLKTKIIADNNTLANRIRGCNRYNYSLEGCWQAFLDWISN